MGWPCEGGACAGRCWGALQHNMDLQTGKALFSRGDVGCAVVLFVRSNCRIKVTPISGMRNACMLDAPRFVQTASVMHHITCNGKPLTLQCWQMALWLIGCGGAANR